MRGGVIKAAQRFAMMGNERGHPMNENINKKIRTIFDAAKLRLSIYALAARIVFLRLKLSYAAG